MYIVKYLDTYILSTLHILVKLVERVFLFSPPDFILVDKNFQINADENVTKRAKL